MVDYLKKSMDRVPRLRAFLSAFPKPVYLWPGIAAFALTGPFGTYEGQSYPARFVFWAAVVLGCGAVFNFSLLVMLTAPRFKAWPRLTKIVLASIVASPFGAIIVYVVNAYYRHHALTFEFFAWLCLCVFGVGIAISLVQYHKPTAAERAFARLSPDNSFLADLPHSLGRKIISMSMRDHYVEVVGDEGSALIHSTFSEAIDGVQALQGVQCHRSHWIAVDAVEDVKLTGRNKHLLLHDGRTIPVSESYADRVRTALAQETADA